MIVEDISRKLEIHVTNMRKIQYNFFHDYVNSYNYLIYILSNKSHYKIDTKKDHPIIQCEPEILSFLISILAVIVIKYYFFSWSKNLLMTYAKFSFILNNLKSQILDLLLNLAHFSSHLKYLHKWHMLSSIRS